MINRVRLVGAVPRLVPLRVVDGWRRLDTAELRSAVTDRTRTIFVNNASFPSGWVASQEEWEAIVDVARSRDLWLVYPATFAHPASLAGMRDRTVTVGDVVTEQRMIGWRIGWLVAPGDLAGDVARAHIYSGLLASGFAQIGARVALEQPLEDLAAANTEWERRRDETMRQLEASRLSPRPAAGRCSWTSPRLDSTVSTPRTGCSTRRSPRRPCADGVDPSPTAMSGSSSATSRSTGWCSWASGSAGRSPSGDRRKPTFTVGSDPCTSCASPRPARNGRARLAGSTDRAGRYRFFV